MPIYLASDDEADNREYATSPTPSSPFLPPDTDAARPYLSQNTLHPVPSFFQLTPPTDSNPAQALYFRHIATSKHESWEIIFHPTVLHSLDYKDLYLQN